MGISLFGARCAISKLLHTCRASTLVTVRWPFQRCYLALLMSQGPAGGGGGGPFSGQRRRRPITCFRDLGISQKSRLPICTLHCGSPLSSSANLSPLSPAPSPTSSLRLWGGVISLSFYLLLILSSRVCSSSAPSFFPSFVFVFFPGASLSWLPVALDGFLFRTCGPYMRGNENMSFSSSLSEAPVCCLTWEWIHEEPDQKMSENQTQSIFCFARIAGDQLVVC